ncbi:hypothetical protein, partial [Pectobacterium odoriferum]|uniref:hypothetical protein n=1 Tax=Pectobacterium odoriferum TaxID=78398 RepID=UPI0021566601
MQKIQHVQPGLSTSEIVPATLAKTSLSQGVSTSASQKGAQSLIQQGLHDKNKPPELEQGNGSSVKSQDSRSTTLRELFSSEGVSQGLPRAPRDSLASGGPLQSLPRFASTEAAEIKIGSSTPSTSAAKSDITLDSHAS